MARRREPAPTMHPDHPQPIAKHFCHASTETKGAGARAPEALARPLPGARLLQAAAPPCAAPSAVAAAALAAAALFAPPRLALK
eukprot:303948-Pleurochrysis_carterae.AAC.1